MAERPMVGVVVVNYNGGDLTLRCLDELHRLTWPADRLRLVLVDNASSDGVAQQARDGWDDVEVVDTGGNLGFAGGCNRGFEHLRGAVDYIALVNNDAVPEPGWLEPLIDLLEEKPNAASASPKVVLRDAYVGVGIESPTRRAGAGDDRPLGVQLCGARVAGVDVLARAELVTGFWGWEHDSTTVGGSFAWTAGAATAFLPAPEDSEHRDHPESVDVELRLACGLGPQRASIGTTANPGIHDVAVGIHPDWFAAGAARPTAVINNAGTRLQPDGSTADRGFLEPDDGRYDEVEEVFGWSGAAVVLRAAHLDALGGFDESFFLYYEDSDLSWRGRLAGWSHWYVPSSVVRHDHSATTGSRSALTRHLADRNRLLMLTRVAPAPLAREAVTDLVTRLGRAAWRDLIVKPLRLHRPVASHVVVLGRIAAGYAVRAPAALRARRTIRGRAGRVDDTQILAWATRNGGAGG